MSGKTTLSVAVWILTFAAAVAAALAALASLRTQRKTSGFALANVILVIVARGLAPIPSIPPYDISRIQKAIENTDGPRIELSRKDQRIAAGMELPQNDDEEIGEGNLASGRSDEALDHFATTESTLLSKLADVHYLKARTFWVLAQSHSAFFDKALQESNSSLGFRPLFSPALVIKCVSLRSTDRLLEALQACNDAVAADKNNEGAWNALGATQIVLGDEAKDGRPYYESAVADIEIGIKIHPTRELWANEAVALESLTRHEDALHAVNEALRISPDFDNALLIKGIILKNLSDTAGAVKIYEKLTTLNPHDAEAWNDLGNALLLNNEPEPALIYFDKALRLSPELAEALFDKGQTLNRLKRYSEAIEPLGKLCKLRSNDAEARYELAFALYESQDSARALAAISRALQLKPRYKAALSLRRAILTHSEATLDTNPPS